MSRVVFWTGPVNLMQVKGASVPGAIDLNIICTGDGVDGGATCIQRADSWGSLIPGTQPDDELFLGAFSAGGSALKRFLMHPEARAQSRALMLSDATYTDWLAPGKPNPPEGFVLFGLEAINGPHMFVATASASPNKTMPNGSQTLASIRLEIEHRSGQTFTELDPTTLDIMPAPVQAWRLGNILFADYQMTVPHGGQAGLAAQYWQKILQPWLASGELPQLPPQVSDPEPSGVDLLDMLVLTASAAAGFAATRWWMKRTK